MAARGRFDGGFRCPERVAFLRLEWVARGTGRDRCSESGARGRDIHIVFRNNEVEQAIRQVVGRPADPRRQHDPGGEHPCRKYSSALGARARHDGSVTSNDRCHQDARSARSTGTVATFVAKLIGTRCAAFGRRADGL